MVKDRIQVALLVFMLIGALPGCMPDAEVREGENPRFFVPRWSFNYAKYSPDGSQLAFFADNPDLNRTVVHFIDSKPVELVPAGEVEGFAWMPDGKSLLVAESSTGTTLLKEYDLQGRQRRVVTPSVPIRPEGGISPILAVSPDGRRAVTPDTDTEIGADLVLVELATGTTSRLERPVTDEFDPSFLSDTEIVYAAARDGDQWVETINIRTEARRRVTPKGFLASTPAVRAGGSFTVYSAYDEKEEERAFYSLELSGVGQKKLHLVEGSHPALHPTEDLVLYMLGEAIESFRF